MWPAQFRVGVPGMSTTIVASPARLLGICFPLVFSSQIACFVGLTAHNSDNISTFPGCYCVTGALCVFRAEQTQIPQAYSAQSGYLAVLVYSVFCNTLGSVI